MADSQTLIEFDPDSLTLGEMEDIEEASGLGFMELVEQFDSQKLTVQSLKAVTWILLRRDNPDLTLDGVRDLTIGELAKIGGSAGPLDEPQTSGQPD